MELTQTSTKTVNQITAEQDGWVLNATVTVQDGKILNIDGYAVKDGCENVTFNAWRNGDKLTRAVHNVTDDSTDSYVNATALFNAAVAKYEAEAEE